MNKKISIAIDGPASAGKSTVAKILAKKLGYIYCDTGAMYRALTYAAIQADVPFSAEQQLVHLLESCQIIFRQLSDGQHVFLAGKDITEAIRQPDVTQAVSEVSAHKAVREELVKRQQKIAAEGGIVMDGRDIGTAVLPNAEIKFFLIASVEERAERRQKENSEKKIPSNYETVKKEIEQRDYLDSHRKVSPLKQAKDAILIDTTGKSISQVVEKMVAFIKTEPIS